MLRTLTVGIVILALVGGFMALDRTVGHWYVPEARTADDIAREFLGDWDRAVPLEAPEVTGKRDEAPPGSSAQLRYALMHFANVSAILLLINDVSGLSDQAKANRLQECEAYLLGRNASGLSCGLIPLGE